jgi:predicted nucleic acid-binding protein
MVLIDTSVWIRVITRTEPFRSEVHKLLNNGRAAAHELVYGELLMGDNGGSRGAFLADYEQMPFARRVPHAEVVSLVYAQRLRGRGVGWVDVHLLASALAGRMKFWTADPPLAAMAEQLGVAYIASR